MVDEFERRLADFCGAPFAVATDSCTNAIFLALGWVSRDLLDPIVVSLPKHTYVGVLRAVANIGGHAVLRDVSWRGDYQIAPYPVWDSAKRLERGMYRPATFACLSFHWSKLLPIGRGGAILLDDESARDWLRSARIDGRREGEDYANPVFQRQGWHMNMHGDDAARGLHLLTYLEDDDPCDWSAYPDLSQAEWT